MERDAILFNTTRGPLVDAATLIEVLKRDTLGRMALNLTMIRLIRACFSLMHRVFRQWPNPRYTAQFNLPLE